MTIRDMDAFVGGLWDWNCLSGCFGGGRISPTDVDGLVERNRHFLFLEAKPPGGELPTGQRITLTNLSRQPNTTCIVINGDPKTENVTGITRIENGVPTAIGDPSRAMLRTIVSAWYARADGAKP